MSKVKYDRIGVDLFEGKDAMTLDVAMELVGWFPEPDDKDFGKDFTLRYGGKKIRLKNNVTNRPFRIGLAKRYKSEHHRRKWKLNGETIIIDRHGMVQSGQHRLIGFILAELERKDGGQAFKDKWKIKSPITMECIVCTGISDRPDVVDTLDLGQSRSLGDVLFRNKEFGKKIPEKEQRRLTNLLAGATRLVWLRTGGKAISSAPHFPHSEALDFIKAHPGLVDAVNFIFDEDGGSGADGRLISSTVSLAYAAGFLYLMTHAKTDPDKFDLDGELDASLKDKAEEFWTLFASGANLENGDPILTLRNYLPRIDASGGVGRDMVCCCIANAFNLWIDNKTGCKASDIKPKMIKNKDTGKLELAELVRIGGIDVHREVEADVDEGPSTATPSKGSKTKGGWKRGDTCWIKEEDGEHWFGEIKDVYETNVEGHPKRKMASVLSVEDSKEYEVNLSACVVNRPK